VNYKCHKIPFKLIVFYIFDVVDSSGTKPSRWLFKKDSHETPWSKAHCPH